VYEQLVERLAQAAPHLKVGPPTEADTVVGPLISQAHRDRVEGYIRGGREEGAELLTGGERPGFDRGFYVAPALLANATNSMKVAREEIFGPVIVVIPLMTSWKASRSPTTASTASTTTCIRQTQRRPSA
jgi:acyl-CoA reductase-like NAD-dependent aldehyde dehydrogenase